MKNISVQHEKIISLYKQGVKNKEIAKQVGVNKDSISRIIRKAEIPFKARITDLSGQRFGKLIVIDQSGRHKNREVRWLCQCDCGSKKIALGSKLQAGNVKSCGCLIRDKLLTGAQATNVQAIYHSYIKNAAGRGIEFDLHEDAFYWMSQQKCYYCGQEPNQIKQLTKNGEPFKWNGIDRTNNKLGYITSNVVPCCKTCNMAKRDMSLYEFRCWIKRVYEYSQQENVIIRRGSF